MSLSTSRKVLMLSGCAALAGCVAGPHFVPPAPPHQSRYTPAPLRGLHAAGVQLDRRLAVPMRWWSVLKWPHLDAAIHQALVGNRTLAAARATLAAAREQAAASTGREFPEVDLTGGAGREKYGAAFLGAAQLPPFTYFSIGASVSYLFDYRGGARRAVEQQRALAEYRAHELDAAALSLSGNVALQALAAASARAQIQTLQTLLNDDRTNLSLVQDAFAAGSGTRVDVLNAQAQLANDQTLLAPLRRALARADDALALLAGRSTANWLAPDFQLAQMSVPHRLPLKLPSALARQRPDILAAQAQLHAATAAVGVATADLYPRITLSGSAALESVNLLHLFDVASSSAAGVSGALLKPLFDHGALRDRQRAARDQMNAALASYEQVVLNSFRQVADALQGLSEDETLVASERHAVTISSQNLSLTRQSYRDGQSTVLRVLDAERSNEQARLGLTRARVQRDRDVIALLLALGGRVPSPPG